MAGFSALAVRRQRGLLVLAVLAGGTFAVLHQWWGDYRGGPVLSVVLVGAVALAVAGFGLIGRTPNA